MTIRHPNGRQAKYLETALNEAADEGPKLVAAEVRRSLR
jgi:hypothetical protein